MPYTTRFAWFPGLDRLAIGLSGLCLIHCVATAMLVALASAVGALLINPLIHEIGLAIAIPLGALALGRGIWTHGYMMPSAMGSLGLGVMAGALTLPHSDMEVVYTLIGVGLLALGHDLNRRAVI
ncbi:MAG: MerC domain-containing protein [Pseudomonadota bacterium]